MPEYFQDFSRQESSPESLYNGHYDTAAFENEELLRTKNSLETDLPAELQTVQALLHADSATWAKHHLPATSRVMTFASELPALPTSDASLTHTAVGYQRDDEVALPRASLLNRGNSPHSLNRWPRLFTIAAAALIVLLLGALFINFAPGRFGVYSHPQRTATPQHTHITPTKWTIASHLAAEQNIPLLAPSNPKVVYEIDLSSKQLPGKQMRRSDDAGATWQTLALPWMNNPLVSETVSGMLAISPVNAYDIVLYETIDLTTYDGSYCPAGTLAPGQFTVNESSSFPRGAKPLQTLETSQGNRSLLSQMNTLGGSVSCNVEYASTDGGLHWTLLHLPLGGLLTFWGDMNPLDTTELQAQGNTLYSSFLVGPDANDSPVGSRIVSSSDGGLTWKLADQSLKTRGVQVCNFIATPSGRTLFAVTNANDCYNAFGQSELWRSDDAGAHWQKVTELASVAPVVQLEKVSQQNGSDILYALFGRTLEMSTDGGQTWQPLSMQGIPTNLELMSSAGIVPSSTGNAPLIATFTKKSQSIIKAIVCYLWQPEKNAWQIAAPPIQDGNYVLNYDYLQITQDAHGNGTLWLVMEMADSDATPVVSSGALSGFTIPSSSHIVVESVPLN